MNKWQRFSKDYLTFTKKDRIGIITLLLFMLIVYLLPRFFSRNSDINSIQADTEILKRIDSLKTRQEPTGKEDYVQTSTLNYERSESPETKPHELFKFDPNTLAAEGWRTLGLQEKTIKVILNFRNKGGKFYKREDLKKIWGLKPEFYEQVKDFIVIAAPASATYFEDKKYEKPANRKFAVELNSADTAAFVELPGIGNKLASRIITFRNRLGGFYSIAQLSETYGLPDSTFQKIKPYLNLEGDKIKKININSATKDELKVHPYIRWNLANAIVEYRNQHGSYKSYEELKNIVILDDATLTKIIPYLSL